MAPKLTQAEWDARAAAVGIAWEADVSRALTKTPARCLTCGFRWDARPASVQQGQGCPSCAGNLPLPQRIWDARAAVDAVIRERTASYRLSDKGRLGAVMMPTAQEWLETGAYEVAVELTTPRSKELLRELRRLREDLEEAALIELASRWGGRYERRYSTARDLDPSRVSRAAEAAERLCRHGWAERGFAITCDRCGMPSFVAVTRTQGSAECPGCGATGHYRAHASGVSVYYRLNTLVGRARHQGILPHILAVTALERMDDQTRALPGIDVVFPDRSTAEIDLAGVHASKVVAGEVKTKARDFTREQIARDICASQRLGADLHVLAALDAVDAETRALAQQAADAAELELLVLDHSSLRPTT